MNTTFILLYVALTHYYHSDDNIHTALDDLIFYGPEVQIADNNLPLEADYIDENYFDVDAEALNIDPEDIDEMSDGRDSIKAESELFDLDEGEFTIEDITVKDEGDEIEITADKKAEKEIKILRNDNTEDPKAEEKEEKAFIEISVIYKDMAWPTQAEAKKIIELNILEDLLLSIKLVKKYPLSYSSVINPPIINRRSYEPINSHLDTVQFYEEYFQMLFVAIDKKDLRAIEILTEKLGFNYIVHAKNQPPFIYAVNKGDINVVRKMLAIGYDPDQKDNAGNAAIHLAVLHNRVDILTELIKANANLTMPNAIYKRPVGLALETEKFYIADLLVKAGAANIKHHKSFQNYIDSRMKYLD